MLKVHWVTLAVLLLCGGSFVRAGEGHSVARATNGGQAVSEVKGQGDGRYYGTASATNGGRADTLVEGGGFNGGYADVLGNSMADGGEAKAFAKGRANGGYAGSTAHAVTINGRSDAWDWACSSGNADAISQTSAFSHHGAAWGRGGAEACGHGGKASSRNTLHSETWGGEAYGESVAISRATRDGMADSETDVLALSRPGRMAQARFTSEANASYGGMANSRGRLRDVR